VASALAGLTGLYGPPEEPHGTTGRPVEDWGTPADPRHAISGDSSRERRTAGTGYGQEPDFAEVGDLQPWQTPPGAVWDHTPSSHAAPYPRGAQQDPVLAAEQLQQLHGVEMGGSRRRAWWGRPYDFRVDAGHHDSPDDSGLAPGVPGQLRSGPAAKDLDQGRGQPNGWGFNLGHQFRRWFQDPIPLDRTGVPTSERPFYGHHPVQQASFDGPDSPYGTYGDTTQGMGLRPTPVGYATPYEQPPAPTMRPTADYTGEAQVIDYGWVATE
jgi:hypothetical protein